jgi:hypothetical protein
MKMGDQKSRDMLEKIYNQTTPTQQTTNVQNGICKSTSPGGCMRKSFDDLGNNLGTKVNEAKDKMMDFMKKSPILTLYNYFLQIMIFSNTLHNAMMLSNSIGKLRRIYIAFTTLPLFLKFLLQLIVKPPSFNRLITTFSNSSLFSKFRCAIYSFALCHTNSIKL